MSTGETADRRNRGTALLGRGLLVAAHDEFLQWLHLVEGSGDPAQVIPALNGLSVVAFRRKDVEGAYRYAERALSLAQLPTAPEPERLKLYMNLVNLNTQMGRLDEALQWVGRVAGLMVDPDGPLTLVYWLNLSNLYWRRQEWVPMLNASREAYRRSAAVGNDAASARALTNLGIANLELGLYAEAEEQLQKALETPETSDPAVVAYVNAELGRLYFLRGEHNEALAAGRKALDALITGVSVFDKEVVAAVSRLFGSIFGTYGQRNLALKYLNRAAAYYSQLGLRAEWQRATDSIGQLLSGPRQPARQQLVDEVQRLDFLTAVLDMTDDLESVDPYLRGHSERVASLAVILGEASGLSQESLLVLGLAAWLHDVGKVAVDAELLQKEGPLTEGEQARVNMHSTIGEEMLRPYGLSPTGLKAIRHHHERFDGKGSPDQLRGEEIPLMARIIAVVDAYDGLTSDRLNRPAVPHVQAADMLRAMSGRELDPELVERFLDMHNVEP
ncbi:MAG: HD domain-containing phosphohydrolase [Bacillota bacterium]